ncbi:DUF5590 domain-containing protein [Bacillus sp. FJAT-29814]|uniref:cell wall elongation regulator TseB-like domain-containing protein n=1 Tax=Bacillus sp. FJAT-29814 TaxID=1729688 RepID=UPI000831CCAE|nr:DUF5590 domain-containing protein [Bacillus sp. FJAT-29814]
MKKWILILIAVVIAALGTSIKVYLSATEPLKDAQNKAIARASAQVHFSKVEDFHIYNGLETVYVIEGENQDGKEIIAWVPDKKGKIIVKKAAEGLTKQEAVQKLLEEKNPEKIISVRLGLEKNIPLWEIYYRSDNDLINYYYIHFETGEWLKKIENL